MIRGETARYAINGAFSTLVHFSVLSVAIEGFDMPSASLANLLAACIGITTSFIGSKYYVFRRHRDPLHEQAAKFVALYGVIALLHAGVMALVTDIGGVNYRIGLVLATALQVLLSFSGNRRLVFK
ncbi:GtrA family protein [Ferribacterium limneticum]|uniref:GtrA family protein n=1 Tax=Ferribacterium limneticum TaxID=76259 RepID=UPI001CFB03DB|nr:GtrA family protein [Ferribacterium limneticum]